MGLFGVLLICHNCSSALMVEVALGDRWLGCFVAHNGLPAGSATQIVLIVSSRGVRSAGEFGEKLI